MPKTNAYLNLGIDYHIESKNKIVGLRPQSLWIPGVTANHPLKVARSVEVIDIGHLGSNPPPVANPYPNIPTMHYSTFLVFAQTLKPNGACGSIFVQNSIKSHIASSHGAQSAFCITRNAERILALTLNLQHTTNINETNNETQHEQTKLLIWKSLFRFAFCQRCTSI